jgi:hypothetical protein
MSLMSLMVVWNCNTAIWQSGDLAMSLFSRAIAFLLILESMLSAFHFANLLSFLAVHDGIALALIVARVLLAALQFSAGWMIASRRPQGYALGPWALAAGALLTPFDVGLNLAPTMVEQWWRTEVTIGYALYAIVGIYILITQSRKSLSP